MLAIEWLCCICNQPITNPICHQCLSKDLLSYASNKKEIESFKKAIATLQQENFSSVKCIKCQKPVIICTACLLELAKKFIKKLKDVRLF